MARTPSRSRVCSGKSAGFGSPRMVVPRRLETADSRVTRIRTTDPAAAGTPTNALGRRSPHLVISAYAVNARASESTDNSTTYTSIGSQPGRSSRPPPSGGKNHTTVTRQMLEGSTTSGMAAANATAHRGTSATG